MRVLTVLLLSLLLALPASAARMVPGGTWITGDNLKNLRLAVSDNLGQGWGTAVGTGYVPTLEITLTDGDSILVSVEGAWEDSTEAACLFTPGTLTALYPATAGEYLDYDFLLYMTKPGYVGKIAADDRAEPFRIRLQRYP